MAIAYQDSAKVHAAAFFAIQWTGAALSFLLLCFRLAIRWRSFKKFSIDDALVVFALACFLVNNILWHYELPKVYILYAAETLKIMPTSGVIADIGSFLRTMPAFNVLFVCCLWSIKFSFLIFFWDLGQRSLRGTAWWWVVTLITLGTMAACIGDYDWGCTSGSDLSLIAYCSSAKAKKEQSTAFRVGISFDLFTDCLIMSIPMIMVWDLQLPMRKKLVLVGVFSLTVITMITALIRLLVVPKGAIGTDLTWSFTWRNVEMSISIIVACLGAFRQLYTSKKSQRDQSPGNSGGFTAQFKLSAPSRSKHSNTSQSQRVTEGSDSTKSLNERDPEST